MGCNEKIHILLERVDEERKDNLKKVQYYLQQGIDVLHLKKLSTDLSAISSAYITKTGRFFGNLEDDISTFVD
jgi:hypothetical protein